MKVLITGVSGFIGGRLLAAACSKYGPSTVVALSSRPNGLCETIVYSGPELAIAPADLTKLHDVEVIIHAGSYTPKDGTQANAIAECNGNITFVEKLFALPLPSLTKLIYLSTLDVYEAADLTSESTPTVPVTLYGMSKLYGERMSEIFSANHSIALQILRLGHVYGPGEEKYAKLLPRAIANIVEDKPVELWGDGSELRSFIYVDDVIASVLESVEAESGIGPINVVGGVALSVRQVLDTVITISGKPVRLVEKPSSGPGRNYIFDNSKLKRYLLAEETTIEVGLRAEYEHVARLR